MALFAAVPPVLAEPGDGRPGAGRSGHFSAERQALREQRRDLRSDLSGDSRSDEAGSGRCDGPPCRMSPDERRQLRRDIHAAGQDIYRRGPRRDRD